MPRMKNVEVGQRPSLQRFTLDELAPSPRASRKWWRDRDRKRRSGVGVMAIVPRSVASACRTDPFEAGEARSQLLHGRERKANRVFRLRSQRPDHDSVD
jgi:hypothetical protein